MSFQGRRRIRSISNRERYVRRRARLVGRRVGVVLVVEEEKEEAWRG